jgi:hypothetical protein
MDDRLFRPLDPHEVGGNLGGDGELWFKGHSGLFDNNDCRYSAVILPLNQGLENPATADTGRAPAMHVEMDVRRHKRK